MSIEWLDPWHAITDPDLAYALEEELRRELAADHPLTGVPVVVIGQNSRNDDILLELKDGSRRVAEVHLTWAGKKELPPWPFAALFESAADWVERGMKVDHEEQSSGG
jgi:hypothetical protein